MHHIFPVFVKKIEYIRIDGRTLSVRRQQLCDQFQRDAATRAAVLSVTAANTGNPSGHACSSHCHASVIYIQIAQSLKYVIAIRNDGLRCTEHLK